MREANTLILYTGDNCHLCEQAKSLIYPVLAQAGWQLKEISITGDSELQEKYGIRIPLIVTPEGEEKGWPFTQGQLVRMLMAE